ncbi:HlyD family type I secretion periplasmic adaptor subunit [Alsobacter soli]|uniref:Membrane fusion protein (MFP) family protein n=1 Tax=Alsobacter soli TaxID=2109933 RepID=A0A2T1HQS4_9HYPH|nr:HlyD family type I secretion periplasmic adaptor subunit [Alsobacter soli]PSC04003.1 HlyD family type I secretion periplasmic adaptor subunit [Alsobacter soli]
MSDHAVARPPALRREPSLALYPESGRLRLGAELSALSRVLVAAAVLFFGVCGGWAATARLSGAVIASGAVAPESTRQTIQHLEGGIIRALPVSEGDHIHKGEPLVMLDDVANRADIVALSTRVFALAAKEARLNAERAGASQIAFEDPVLVAPDKADPDFAIRRQVQQQELAFFRTRQGSLQSQRNVLNQRIAQLQAQSVGFETQLGAVRQQLALLRREIAVADDLYKRGYEKLPRLLSLQRSEADRQGAEGELSANLARAGDQISEIRAQIAALDTKRLEEIDGELADLRSKRADAEETVRKTQDKLERSVVRAPVNGVVLNLRFKTLGGIVRPGEPIMEIVPTDDTLIINARLSPRNIDEVQLDKPAHVIFPSYTQRGLLRIPARLIQVSPDSMTDDRTGQSYYAAKVAVDREELKRIAPQVELVPGLPAEVYIATTERTVLDYILQPLRLLLERGMRET